MDNKSFSLFPQIGSLPSDDLNSSVLESYDPENEDGMQKSRNNNNRLNKEAPGLFPPINSNSDNGNDIFGEKSSNLSTATDTDIKFENIDNAFDVSTSNDLHLELNFVIDFHKFQKTVIEKLPEDYANQLVNDKFFLAKLYQNSNEIYFHDFEAYDSALKLEDKLRETLLNINNQKNKEHRLSETQEGANIPIVAEEGLNDLYLYSREPDIRFFQNLKKKKATSFFNTFKRKLTKPKESAEIYNGDGNVDLEPKMVLERIDSNAPTICLDEAQSLTNKKSLVLFNRLNFTSNGNIDERIGIDSSDYIGSLVNVEKDENNFAFGLENKKTAVLQSNFTNIEYGHLKMKPEYTLQRKLRMRHLQMLSIGASIGIGLFLQSGKAISIAGGLGAWIGFAISATLVISTLLCFGEIVALLPVNTGVTGILHRFLNPSLSFSVSWVYLISYCLSVPSEVLASSLLLSYFDGVATFFNDSGKMSLILILFSSFIIFINLMDVRVYAEFEYITSTGKIIVILGLIVFMLVLNSGGVKTIKNSNHYMGFSYWDSKKNIKNEPTITFGPFRPSFDLNDIGFGAKEGIRGFGGVLLQIIAASSVAVYSYIGTEIGFIGAAESSVQLRRSISSVAKRIYIRVILFYLVSVFLLSLLIYSGDPRLLRYRGTSANLDSNLIKDQLDNILNVLGLSICGPVLSSEYTVFSGNATQSPWIIMLSNFKLCKFAQVLDGIFVAIGLCAASSQLYVASRILHSMSIQDKAPRIFAKCNKYGVPYVAVLSCGAFSFLSLLGINNNSVISLDRLVQMGTQGAVIMWFFMNVAFLRFYYAVKNRPDLLDRDSKEYPYRSPLQPYMAYYGATVTAFLFLVSGFANFVEWNTTDFIVDYLALAILIVLYVGYQSIKKPKVFWDIEDIDLDIGRKELDRELWKEGTEYMPTFKEALKKILSYI